MKCLVQADVAQAAILCAPATTFELNRELQQINQLIAVLRTLPVSNPEDFDDLRWMQERRAFVLSVLAWRFKQKHEKIVSLVLWRSGGIPTAKPALRGAKKRKA